MSATVGNHGSMVRGLISMLGSQEMWLGAFCLATFFVVRRILRGALTGMLEMQGDDPEFEPPGRLQRTLTFLALGLTAMIAGVCFALFYGIQWSLPFFAGGVGLVLWRNQASITESVSSEVHRHVSELSHLLLNSGLVAGILIIANVAAFRYGGQGIDLTRERTFSLSSLSLRQVESLKRPVTFHVVYGGGARSTRQLDRVVQLLDLYRGANPGMVKVESLNPWTELARGEELTRRAPDLAVMRGGGVLIEYGEGSSSEFAVVSSQEMFQRIPDDPATLAPDRFSSSFRGEDAITSALVRLQEGRKSKVAFLTGHGEPSSLDTNTSGPGLGLWRARLASVGCEPVELNLLADAIPDDLDLLILAGPRSPLKPDEIAKIKGYSERGGPLLFLLGNTEPAGLEDFLRGFNLELQKGLIVDPGLNFNRNPRLVFAPLQGVQTHPIAASLPSDRAILVPNGAPIQILGQGPASPGRPVPEPVNSNLVPLIVLRTSPRSWAETDLTNPLPRFDQGADLAGPLNVGVAIQERVSSPTASGPNQSTEPRPRLVLFSSRSLADNLVQGIEPTNLDLLMNTTSWLQGRPDVVGIAANTHVALTLTADPQLRSRLVLVPTVLVVLATISTGILVYFYRRE